MRSLLLLLPAVLLLGIGYLSFSSSSTAPEINDRLDAKYEPAEHFLLSRSYPDDFFDVDAYVDARKQAAYAANWRNGAGFDAEWTVQGPGNIGGRSNTVALHPSNEDIMYAGFADGGVFKTEDGGLNWAPIFDEQPFLAIGDIVVDPSNPETVYVGTGDPNISGLPSIGNGLYRSIDGGDNWTYIGLEETRIISKIELHPTNPDIIYVSAMGLPFQPNSDRGVYKTIDGGDTWDQVLYLSDTTGVIDMLINPQDPDVLYAAGWDRIRNSGRSLLLGEGGRIHKSVDGGATWTMLQNGLPSGDMSRIGLAMSGQNPDVVYAMFVHLQGGYQLEGIYKSENAGANWSPVPTDYATGLSDNALGGFGWYFGKLRVNPNNDDDLFLLGIDLWRTQNSGLTWELAAPEWWEYEVHADKHDLVFAPSGDIVIATDGGLYRTSDDAQNWEDIEDIATTQFYRVAHNPHTPAFYYGGAQDNGTTGGNKEDINQWPRIFGGDGFQPNFDPENPNVFYAETQNGGIYVTFDGGYYFQNGTIGIDPDDRQNWDMPYLISPHSRSTLYTGTDKVYAGISIDSFAILEWEAISEELTVQPSGRNRNISALDESPVVEGRLYAGTANGYVHTQNPTTGAWINITAGLPERYVTDIKASPTFGDHVFVSHSGYRDNINIPHVHLSKDAGATWEDISSDLPQLAVNAIYILPNNMDSVIFAATDGGVYGTKNGGNSWARLGSNMPSIPVFDLDLNPDRNELVAGTFARSIMTFPLDSIGVSSEMTTSTSSEPSLAFRDRIKISPNPARDFIEVSYFNIEPGKASEIVVIDATGRLVLSRRGINTREVRETFDISSLPSGNYFVKVKVRHDIMSSQFIKL